MTDVIITHIIDLSAKQLHHLITSPLSHLLAWRFQ